MPQPRQHVVIHAGFHKTGTSSVQATLRENGPHLWPVMALETGHRIKPIRAAARGFSTWRDPLTLAKFGVRFAKWLQGLDLPPKRQLLICSEELCGHLPGRGDLADYSAAPELMGVLAEELEAAFGARLDLTFFFSLRQPEAWLQSAYWEHVKASRMVLTFDDFLARYSAAADLPAMVGTIRAAVAPHKVETAWLEDCDTLPLGPATPLLALMRLSPEKHAALVPAPRRNAATPDLIAPFLEINRSPLSDDDAKAAKERLLGATR